VVEGNKVDHRVFLDWIQELADEGMYTFAVGYDRWHMDTILADMKRMVGEKNVEPVIQGAQTLSQPMKQLKADLRDNRIVNNHNPIDEWCNMNVSAKVDINDNVQPVKSGGATTRIDGFMALLIGYIALQRHEDDYRMAIGDS
jgi:phage terminase large subunit-like protein